ELGAILGIAKSHMARDPRRRQFPGERRQGRARLGPGQADDRDRGAPGGGRRGVDRVGERRRRQCFGGSWSGISIKRSTRPPFLTWVSRISSMSTSRTDRKSTRLNSSHVKISYAVFCLKKKSSAAHDEQDPSDEAEVGAG